MGSSSQERRTLAQPLGRLHFAGEATNDRFPATVHGALLSGRRAATEIVEGEAKKTGAAYVEPGRN